MNAYNNVDKNGSKTIHGLAYEMLSDKSYRSLITAIEQECGDDAVKILELTRLTGCGVVIAAKVAAYAGFAAVMDDHPDSFDNAVGILVDEIMVVYFG